MDSLPIDGKINQNANLIDELEASFLDCLSLLTCQDHFAVQDTDETKTSVENAMQKFLDISRKTEAFFLRKRMLISFQKPEQILNEDNQDLRAELARKEQLIERHMERLNRCQMMLKDRDGSGQSVSQPQSQQTPQHTPQQQQALPQQPSQPAQSQPHMATAGAGHLPQYSQQHHLSQMPTQPPGGMVPGPTATGPAGPGPYQGYLPTMHGQGPMSGPQSSQMQSHSMGMGPRQPPPPSYPQGPLASLEQTTSNIGMSDRR